MGTYNGAGYLREQIDSILEQTYPHWNLIIRDDGSSDNTIDLINDYLSNDARISLIQDDVKCNSAPSNFMQLLKYSQSEIICFCDQDDIWLDNKLELMLSKLEKKDTSLPQVIFSDGYLYYGKNFFNLPRLLHARPKNLKETLFCNGGIHGSTSIFNAVMREKMLSNIEFIAMHDHLLTLIGCAYKTIDYLEIPTFYYRQHSGNVTPHISQNFFSRICKFFKNMTKYSVVDNVHYLGVISFYKVFKNEILPNDQKLCDLYIEYPNVNAFSRFFSIIKNGFSLNNSRPNLYIKLLFKRYIDKK